MTCPLCASTMDHDPILNCPVCPWCGHRPPPVNVVRLELVEPEDRREDGNDLLEDFDRRLP